MKKSLIRTIIIIIVVVGLGYVGYAYFFANKAPASTDSLATTSGVGSDALGTTSSSGFTAAGTTPSSGDVGQDFLTLLLSVRSIKLDDSIFKDKAFGLLQDFNRPIPPDADPGRVDPFAPIGADSPLASASVTTSNASSIGTSVSTLNGSLSQADASTTRWFEYGTTQNLGTMTTPKTQSTPGAFAENVTGLTPNTTYYVKASALIGGATVSGNVITWKTAQGGTQKH